jgi:hypothetical protein
MVSVADVSEDLDAYIFRVLAFHKVLRSVDGMDSDDGVSKVLRCVYKY